MGEILEDYMEFLKKDKKLVMLGHSDISSTQIHVKGLRNKLEEYKKVNSDK